MSVNADVNVASEPSTKRQKLAPPKKRVMMVNDLHICDTNMMPLVKSSKCNLVPIVCKFDNKSPVLVQLSGDGKIPLSFGIEDTDTDGRRKVQVAFQIDNQSDHDQLVRLRTELSEAVVDQWAKWFPDIDPQPSKEVLQTMCNTFVSGRKKKTNSEDRWSGVSKAKIEPEECLNGRCKIVDRDTGDIVPFSMLPGRLWHKIILEFRYIYIQSTKSYGITRKVRYISSSQEDEDGDVSPL